jgi:hypothetical protein
MSYSLSSVSPRWESFSLNPNIKQSVQALKRNGDPIGTVLQFVAKLIEGLLKRKQIDEGRGMA